MVWGPDDWDAWTLTAPEDDAPPPPDEDPVREFLRAIPGRRAMTVADLGCGRGDWIAFLSSHFGQVVAVDYAPFTLAAARRGCKDRRVIFRRRDLRDLGPLRGAIHVALALESILGPAVEDVDRMLGQVHASLVDGGLFVGTFPARPRRGGPVPMALSGFPVPEGPLRFSEVDLQYRLRRAGFRGVRTRRLPAACGRAERLFAIAARRGDN
jgi:SAM-dependent methyltransferase